MARKRSLLLIISILLFITSGVSFAYFLLTLGSQGEVELANTAKKPYLLEFNYGSEAFDGSNFQLNETRTKEFSAHIQANKEEVTYAIYLNIQTNTFKKCNILTYYEDVRCNDENNTNCRTNKCEMNAEELTYVLKEKKQDGETPIAQGDLTGKSGTLKLATITHQVEDESTYDYILEITYNETGSEQNHNAGAQIEATVVGGYDIEVEEQVDEGIKLADYLTTIKCQDEINGNCLVDEGIHGLRYEGKTPNNYVSLNGDLWRIIGIIDTPVVTEECRGDLQTCSSEKLIKIIRNEPIGNLAWDEGGSVDWVSSSLQRILNTDFINEGYSKGDSLTVYKLDPKNIEEVVWPLKSSNINYTTEQSYDSEYSTGTVLGSAPSWAGKVGLLLPSDYGYAALASSCSRDTSLHEYNKEECTQQNWLYFSGIWLMSSSTANYTLRIYSNGYLSNYEPTNEQTIYPVVFLKSNANFTITNLSNLGTIENPYIVD